MTARRLLHLHSSFNLGGKEARAVQLMNAFGGEFTHDIVSAVSSETGAAALIAPDVAWRLRDDFPSLAGRPGLARLRALADAMRGYDLVLTYNWGAMDAVLAHRLFGGPPLVHHEDGFNADEAGGQKRSRIWMRRLALRTAKAVGVPSRNLERIARGVWRQRRVRYMPNGVDTALYEAAPAPDAIPGFTRRPGELVVGTMAGLRAVKNLPRLVRAFAAAANGIEARLVIVGDGPEAAAIRAAAEAAGVGDRVVMPGFVPHPHRYAALFDVFALSSDSEQFPISLVEAMAAGLPVACTDVGDVREIVAAGNLPFVVSTDGAALAGALGTLLRDADLRKSLGQANRDRVRAEFGIDRMLARYRALYEEAMR
jgi:glycosyltransferase involved in cell wall biosynthesis